MTLNVLNPVSRKIDKAGASAARLATLEGKTIGLYWNHKPGGESALARIDELLKQRFKGVTTRHYAGSMGGAVKSATKEDVATMVSECAAVVGTTAD